MSIQFLVFFLDVFHLLGFSSPIEVVI